MAEAMVSARRASATEAELVREQIRSRWGDDEVERFDDLGVCCFTASEWNELGYRVKPGEVALEGFAPVTLPEKFANLHGCRGRPFRLYYALQVEKER